MSSKVCTRCKAEKDIESFWKRRDSVDGRYSRCADCTRTQCSTYRSKNRDTYRRLNKANWRKLRGTVLEGYGAKCNCCGEERYEFLALDHVHGGGNKHRKHETGSSTCNWPAYKDARDRNFPPEYQILCHNCNQAKGYYGVCPHERERNGVCKDNPQVDEVLRRVA